MKDSRINIVKILNYRNLNKAIKRATRGRFKYKYGATKFITKLPYSLQILKESIISYIHHSKMYSVFSIKDTKTRFIHAPCFIDKVVQYAIAQILDKVLPKYYIYDSYACIKSKGPQKAVLRIQQFQTNAYNRYKHPTLVKIDISKFFYSINRTILFNILCKYIKCEDTRILLIEKLKFFNSSKGLPLGNLTSQIFANVLLNEFDQYAKRVLKVNFYVRYADDIFIIVDSKKRAKEVMNLSKRFLKEELDLNCNPNKCYIKPANMITGLGFNIVRDKNGKQKLYALSRTKRKLYKLLKCKYVVDKSVRSHMSRIWGGAKSLSRPATIDDILIRLNSWYGHVKLASIHSYIFRTLERSGRSDITFDGTKFVKA